MVILDDRSDVWEDDLRKNLIKCWPYNYLDSQADQIKQYYPEYTVAPSKNKSNSSSYRPNLDACVAADAITPEPSIQDIDVQLAFLGRFLRGCAQDYYLKKELSPVDQEIDIRRVVASRFGAILQDCVIILCGFAKGIVRSTGKPGEYTDFHYNFQVFAEKLGAIVTDDPNHDRITHCVIMRSTPEVEIVRSSRPNAIFVTSPWLHGCYHLNIRIPERVFAYKGQDFKEGEKIGLKHSFIRIRDLIRSYGRGHYMVVWLPPAVVKRQLFMDEHERKQNHEKRTRSASRLPVNPLAKHASDQQLSSSSTMNSSGVKRSRDDINHSDKLLSNKRQMQQQPQQESRQESRHHPQSPLDS
eukprot:GHVH01015432.1.p1 GENE.GHVH01015432.1~~GHVH01015432.1.p1  ORF type:complete len:356 (+),score=39.03 GHVH01015432.1:301-1368(+)